VSRNTALTYIECFLNPLTTLDVSKNTALEAFGYDSNVETKGWPR